MLLVVGLGNPGGDYARNRHNIGFMAVDEIVRRHGFSAWRTKFQGEVAEGRIGTEKVLALKPLTFMNESGRAVAAAAQFYKIPPEDIVVLHDELDLAGGKIRVKVGGGHAGHNGLRSIHAHLGPDYKRLRMGIGHPGDKTRVTGHVLKDFSKAEQAWLDPLIDAVARHVELLLSDRDSDFMSKVAMDAPAPKPDKPNKEGTDD